VDEEEAVIDRDEQQPLPLHELRTPMPLRDADFAAIRARVAAEIARPEKPRLLWPRFAFGFAAVAVIAMLMRDTAVPPAAPQVHLQTVTRGGVVAPQAVAPPVRSAGVSPAGPPASRRRTRRSGGETPPSQPARTPALPETAVSRIEIYTADPSIRIIWISDPTVVKEES
jgi:hypothetical protein